ncbi:hypothetical protein U1Q18_009942, partial [Sarracenia purpurea var. burkii]
MASTNRFSVLASTYNEEVLNLAQTTGDQPKVPSNRGEPSSAKSTLQKSLKEVATPVSVGIAAAE